MNVEKLIEILDIDIEFKRCINKIPFDTMLHSYEDIKTWKYELGMCVPRGYVVVDIDDMDQAIQVSKWLKEDNIKCCEMDTRKGKHFIFKSGTRKFKNSADSMTYLHDSFFKLRIDIRAAKNNKRQAGYIILPDGVSYRKYVKIEEPDVIPAWLLPNNSKTMSNVFDLSGDKGSRNNEMLKYTLHLRDFSNLAPKNISDLMTFINSKWKTQLPFDEMKTLLRDENIKKKKDNNIEKDIALQILDEYQIRKNQGKIFIFTGFIYELIDEDYIRTLVLHEYNDNLKYAKRNEIFRFIYDFLFETLEDNNKNKFLLATPNAIINLKDGTLLNNDGTIFITSGIKYNYDEDIYNAFCDKYMTDLFGEYKQMIYEAIGYSFMRTSAMRHSFWFVGPHGTGKSFFIDDVLSKIYTSISNLDIKAINSTFGAEELSTSMVNFPDDLSLKTIGDASVFKSAISGNTIDTDRKNKSRAKFRTISTWFITGNSIPDFTEKDDAIYDRMIIIPVENKIKRDPFLIDKIDEQFMLYLVSQSIKAAKDVIERGHVLNLAKDALAKYIAEVDNVAEFLNETNIDGMSVKGAFFEFKVFCEENMYKPLQKRVFEQKLTQKNYIKSTNDKRISIWRLKK